MHYITPLYEAISAEKPLLITYHSFKHPRANTFVFSPYVLKEFRNRWFVFGRRKGKAEVFNLALDRIQSIEPAPQDSEYIPIGKFNPETYFNDLIGVTKDRAMKPQKVRFRAAAGQVPYIRTKPLHKSQMVVEIDEDGNGVFQLEVILNYELEKDFLGFGESIQVLSPKSLRDSVAKRLRAAAKNYD